MLLSYPEEAWWEIGGWQVADGPLIQGRMPMGTHGTVKAYPPLSMLTLGRSPTRGESCLVLI